jgi:hypothetical protein
VDRAAGRCPADGHTHGRTGGREAAVAVDVAKPSRHMRPAASLRRQRGVLPSRGRFPSAPAPASR